MRDMESVKMPARMELTGLLHVFGIVLACLNDENSDPKSVALSTSSEARSYVDI